MIELKTKEDYDKFLNYCKELVIKDINEGGMIKEWDGKPTGISAEDHFNNIIKWCNDNIKTTVWSGHASSRAGFRTSYGAKHNCERDLKCYVANNWMKLAWIFSGLEVCSAKCVDYESGKVEKYPVQLWDILTNSENFICRRSRKKEEYYSIKYNCLNNCSIKEIKYCGGKYEE